VKYIQWSAQSGRGYKIICICDEIAFSYFVKLKDQEDEKRERQNKKEARKKLAKQPKGRHKITKPNKLVP